MKIDSTHTLDSIYDDLVRSLEQSDYTISPPINFDKEAIQAIDVIAKNSENFLAVVNVVITSLFEKIEEPSQDIRIHQAKMPNGYSGRTLDTRLVTPWLKSKNLKSMRESGWLTRSLEQDAPYTLDYRGAIRNKEVKTAFLRLLDKIENEQLDPRITLSYLLQLLIIQRENNKISINPLASRTQYNISAIIELLSQHFQLSHQIGTARLPVLAIYSVYESLIVQLKRYQNKILKPLGSHTSADLRSGDIGDIQINNEDDTPFEGVEVKYKKLIDSVLVNDAYEKIKTTQTKRYYLLSTEVSLPDEIEKIQQITLRIESEHGCQIIVNGLLPTLKYYLRLVDDLDEFVQNYTKNILSDPVVKQSHKKLWKDLLDSLT